MSVTSGSIDDFEDYHLESAGEYHRNVAVKSFIDFIETSLFLLILLHFSGVTNGILFPPVTGEAFAEESSAARMLWFPIYGLVGLLILKNILQFLSCLLYTSPSPRDQRGSRMPSSA